MAQKMVKSRLTLQLETGAILSGQHMAFENKKLAIQKHKSS